MDSGFTYSEILTFSEIEIAIILGVTSAIAQRREDERERQERMADQQRRSKSNNRAM